MKDVENKYDSAPFVVSIIFTWIISYVMGLLCEYLYGKPSLFYVGFVISLIIHGFVFRKKWMFILDKRKQS